MEWARETGSLLVSNEGYKIGRYVVGKDIYYRPSLKGDFIAPPTMALDEAKAQCEKHHGGSNESDIHRRQKA